jgi:hypothetical protein
MSNAFDYYDVLRYLFSNKENSKSISIRSSTHKSEFPNVKPTNPLRPKSSKTELNSDLKNINLSNGKTSTS